jgi:hypothetical protein
MSKMERKNKQNWKNKLIQTERKKWQKIAGRQNGAKK